MPRRASTFLAEAELQSRVFPMWKNFYRLPNGTVAFGK